MENSIKRVFVRNDSKKLVIVRENEVEVFDTDIKAIYNNALREISDEFDAKTLKELNNALMSYKIIRIINNMFINKLVFQPENNTIQVFRNFEIEPEEIVIQDSEELNAAYEDLKDELLSQYEINSDSEDVKKRFEIKEEKLKKLSILKEKKSKTIKNLKVSTLALVIAGAIGISSLATWAGVAIFSKKDTNKPSADKEVEDDLFSESQNPFLENGVLEEDIYFPSEEDLQEAIELYEEQGLMGGEFVFPTEEKIEEPIVQTSVPFSDLGIDLTGEEIKIDITEETIIPYVVEDVGYENSTDELIELSLEQMSRLGSKLQNPNNEYDYSGSIIFFEKKFTNFDDVNFVRYFSALRNEVVIRSCMEKDLDLAKDYIKAANMECVKYLEQQEPLIVTYDNEEHYLFFEDLSDEAKRVVFNLAYSMQIAMAHEDFFYNGTVYDQNAMYEVLENINNSMNFSK